MRARSLFTLGIIMVMTVVSVMAGAHELDVTTARISLRDEHVQVDVRLDLLVLLAATAPSWPGRAGLSRLNDQELTSMLGDAMRMLQRQAQLTVNGVPVALMLRHVPTATDLRAIAGRQDAPGNGHVHREMTRLRFETAGSRAQGDAIGFQLPASLGSVLYTFVQPNTRMAQPGASVAFPIAHPAAQIEHVATGEPGRSTDWLRSIVAVAAVMLALSALVLQRQNRLVKAAP